MADLPVVCVDNGADTIKAGLIGRNEPSLIIPNGTAVIASQLKKLVADQFNDIHNKAPLRFSKPFDRGCLVNTACETEVWKRLFGKHCLDVNPKKSILCLTASPSNMLLPSLQRELHELVFETFSWRALYLGPAQLFAAHASDQLLIASGKASPVSALVVDCGYSNTHVVPVFGGCVVKHAVKRIDIGGKLLTNFLKDTVSYRAYNMMEETSLLRDVKEQMCFCALDFAALIRAATVNQRSLRREYILPDYNTVLKGYVRPDPPTGKVKLEPAKAPAPAKRKRENEPEPARQSLVLSTARVAVPELVFSPSRIGLKQGGVHEAIMESVGLCHADMQESLLGNIVLTGGSTRFPNFKARLERELRRLAPTSVSRICVRHEADAITGTWRGLSHWASVQHAAQTLLPRTVTRKEYNEYGHWICDRKFAL